MKYKASEQKLCEMFLFLKTNHEVDYNFAYMYFPADMT